MNRMEVISGELLEQGYSRQEISTAFSWLLEKVASPAPLPQPDARSFRILNDIERIFISKEAYGYLLQLSTLGLITPEELEGIIEKAVMRSSPGLGVEEIKLLTAEALFEVRSADSPGEALFPPDTVH